MTQIVLAVAGLAVLGVLAADRLPGSRSAWALSAGVLGALCGAVFVAVAVITHGLRIPRFLATGVGGAALAWQAAAAADQKVSDLATVGRKLVYGMVLSEAQGRFKFAAASLPDEAKAQLDKMVADISADPKAVFFEIEGHTDNTGSTVLNEKLGMERAEAVKRYLYQQHQIPLHKINVISYGEEKPVAPNNTRDGRAQNRRVVVRVLA